MIAARCSGLGHQADRAERRFRCHGSWKARVAHADILIWSELALAPREPMCILRRLGREGGKYKRSDKPTELTGCVKLQAVEDQISFFGQTPSQLFRRRHPKRGPPPPPANHPLLNGPEAMKLAIVGKPPARRCRSLNSLGSPWAVHIDYRCIA